MRLNTRGATAESAPDALSEPVMAATPDVRAIDTLVDCRPDGELDGLGGEGLGGSSGGELGLGGGDEASMGTGGGEGEGGGGGSCGDVPPGVALTRVQAPQVEVLDWTRRPVVVL